MAFTTKDRKNARRRKQRDENGKTKFSLFGRIARQEIEFHDMTEPQIKTAIKIFHADYLASDHESAFNWIYWYIPKKKSKKSQWNLKSHNWKLKPKLKSKQ